MATILVVDDEEDVRAFLAEALEGDGHTCCEAENGQKALAELGRRRFDLLITDLNMPKMTGVALLRAARELDPDLAVILLTAHGSVETAVEAMKLGAFDYLQKPVASPQALRALASRALSHRGTAASAEGAEKDTAPLPLTYGAPAMAPVVEALRKVAATDATVLVVGESGTGKELAARAIHRWSKRADKPFVAINCAALSAELLESELFGHEKGSFTGALATRKGRIELAEGGTFFLDEVGELQASLQAKLLRVLQERAYERVGGARTLAADVRIVAATNRDLEQMVDHGTFREDLYHRLAVFPVELPPLRDRPTDIVPIAEALLPRIASHVGRPRLSLTEGAKQALVQAPWRGNVRELSNTLERAAILAEGEEIREDLLFPARRAAKTASKPVDDADTLDAMERKAIERALSELGGNRRKAAERLGIGLRTLYEKLKRYGISSGEG